MLLIDRTIILRFLGNFVTLFCLIFIFAVSIDVINMPEAGRTGVEFQLMVRALDQFGNVDENFERAKAWTDLQMRMQHALDSARAEAASEGAAPAAK